jgi:hypothetical protein
VCVSVCVSASSFALTWATNALHAQLGMRTTAGDEVAVLPGAQFALPIHLRKVGELRTEPKRNRQIHTPPMRRTPRNKLATMERKHTNRRGRQLDEGPHTESDKKAVQEPGSCLSVKCEPVPGEVAVPLLLSTSLSAPPPTEGARFAVVPPTGGDALSSETCGSGAVESKRRSLTSGPSPSASPSDALSSMVEAWPPSSS